MYGEDCLHKNFTYLDYSLLLDINSDSVAASEIKSFLQISSKGWENFLNKKDLVLRGIFFIFFRPWSFHLSLPGPSDGRVGDRSPFLPGPATSHRGQGHSSGGLGWTGQECMGIGSMGHLPRGQVTYLGSAGHLPDLGEESQMADGPKPMNRITDMKESITFPRTAYLVGNKWNKCLVFSSGDGILKIKKIFTHTLLHINFTGFPLALEKLEKWEMFFQSGNLKISPESQGKVWDFLSVREN